MSSSFFSSFGLFVLLLPPLSLLVVGGPLGSDSDDFNIPSTVPAFPLQPEIQTCHLDLSAELFGGVSEACGRNLDRSRCCPVLAAWLFAAHSKSALKILPPASSTSSDLPIKPDDSQKCVNSLQSSLLSQNIHIPQPNSTCDAILCFCGIRLHHITSLSCPAAFNVSSGKNAVPLPAVRDLEKNCKNSSYAGCTRCLTSLQKLKGATNHGGEDERASKMFSRDCQLMGLTWLLARNKKAFIPTVSAVLRAVLYSSHPHQSKCSPDQENMPLAVDSLQFQRLDSSSTTRKLSYPAFSLLPLCSFLFLRSLLDHMKL